MPKAHTPFGAERDAACAAGGSRSDLPLEVRVEVRPPWPFRLQRHGGKDGVLRCRDGVLQRLLHVEGDPVVVRVAQPSPERVVFGAVALTRDAAEYGIERMRFAVGVDDDLRAFHGRFRFDPLIGRAVRSLPHLRIRRRPEPFEALAWAVCEQLIEFERACEIERRIVWHARHKDEASGLWDVPTAAEVVAMGAPRLESFDLSPARAITLIRAAREVACGRVDLHAPDHERGWARLRQIRGIGAWTLEFLALHGQGRFDQLPAGDLAYRKFLGRLRDGGRPSARADEEEVREFFAPYGEWAGLAGAYALAGSSRMARSLAA